MKKLNIILTLLVSLSVVPILGATERAVKVLYVSSMLVNLDHADIYSKVLTNTIRTELGKSSTYKLANPETEHSVELVKNYNERLLSIEETVRKEAMAVDADLVLISEVESLEGQCRLSMRLEDIYTRVIIKNKNLRASCSLDALEAKAIELVYMIMKNELIRGKGSRSAFITSDPPGAKVIINNDYVGHTPLDLKIPTGHVKILMEIENSDRFAPILVNELVGESQNVFAYHKVFAERNAYLVLDINPTNGKVVVNNKEISRDLIKKIPVEIRKDHVIIVSAVGYEEKSINVSDLEPGEEFKLNIKLTPSPCNFILSTNPKGAEVKKNGIKVGTTPYEEKVTPSEYQYTVQKQFYNAQSISFHCAPDEKVQRVLVLTRARYTEEEQDRIDLASNRKKISYYGFGAGLGLAVISYAKYNEYKKLDSQYGIATNSYEIESLKAKRASAKGSASTLAIGSAATIGISYLLYKWGGFPEDLKEKNTISVIPTNTGAVVAWQIYW